MVCKHNWLLLDKDEYCPVYNVRWVNMRIYFVCEKCGKTKFHMTKVDKGEEEEEKDE